MKEIHDTPPLSLWLSGLAVAGTVLTWASSFAAIGFALREMPPLPLASLRFFIAGAVALAWLAWRRPAGFSGRDFGTVAICGVLGIAAYNLMLNSGQTDVSAGAASFIVNTQPLFMAILGVAVLKEAFNRWSWIGAAIGFGGVAVIAWGQKGGFAFGAGASLIVGAALSAAIYSVLQRPLLRRHSPLDVTAFVLVAGCVALLAWLPEGFRRATEASEQTLLMILFLALGPGIIGQACWTVAIKGFGAARAGQFLYLVPPVAVAMAWIVLGEVPEITTVLGGVLALTGVILVNSKGRLRT
jgi:drug/metabolite transporter (DMT)-like permease